MKHLANCTYEEFMAQALKMKDLLADWLKETGAADIRERHKTDNPDDAWSAALGFMAEMEIAAFRKCPELTKQLLCLATFSDEYDEKLKGEYIDAAYTMYLNRETRDFFTLSMRQTAATSSPR